MNKEESAPKIVNEGDLGTGEKVIIFSAPSGSGKSTLVAHALQHFKQLAFSISCTTRALRGEEKNGKDYHFLSLEEFSQKIKEDLFVEFEEVYPDKFYGTLKSEVEHSWKARKVVIFDVDVKGGLALKKYFGAKALSIFIKPPSVEELERRLIARNTDDAAAIKTRLGKVEEELSYQNQFDVILVNDVLEDTQQEMVSLIKNFIK